MQLASKNRQRSLPNRAHARGAIVRTNRRQLCAAISTNCRVKHHRMQRSCARLGIISQDPIGFAAGDANLYRYVGNEPTTKTDPSGLEENPTSRTQIEQDTGPPAVRIVFGWVYNEPFTPALADQIDPAMLKRLRDQAYITQRDEWICEYRKQMDYFREMLKVSQQRFGMHGNTRVIWDFRLKPVGREDEGSRKGRKKIIEDMPGGKKAIKVVFFPVANRADAGGLSIPINRGVIPNAILMKGTTDSMTLSHELGHCGVYQENNRGR